jgi:deoxycytidylate deaminase
MPKLDIERIKRDLRVPAPEDNGYLNILFEVSAKSTGKTRRQGALLVKDGSIIATGCFEAYPAASPDKADVEIGSGAIENAIATCAKLGISTNGAVLYTFTFPNAITCRLIVKAGISDIRFVKTTEGPSLGMNLCREKNIKINQIQKMT